MRGRRRWLSLWMVPADWTVLDALAAAAGAESVEQWVFGLIATEARRCGRDWPIADDAEYDAAAQVVRRA